MKLNLYLYKDNQLIYQVLNCPYQTIANKITFMDNNISYEINLSPENFIFTRYTPDGHFTIDYQNKNYLYYLKEQDASVEIPCTYQKYTYQENYVTYEYQIASDASLNKIVLERK